MPLLAIAPTMKHRRRVQLRRIFGMDEPLSTSKQLHIFKQSVLPSKQILTGCWNMPILTILPTKKHRKWHSFADFFEWMNLSYQQTFEDGVLVWIARVFEHSVPPSNLPTQNVLKKRKPTDRRPPIPWSSSVRILKIRVLLDSMWKGLQCFIGHLWGTTSTTTSLAITITESASKRRKRVATTTRIWIMARKGPVQQRRGL
jgi:hypothetical protein